MAIMVIIQPSPTFNQHKFLMLHTMLLFVAFCLFILRFSLLLFFFRAMASTSLTSFSSAAIPHCPLGNGCLLCFIYSMNPFTSSLFLLALFLSGCDPSSCEKLPEEFGLPAMPALSCLHDAAFIDLRLWTFFAQRVIFFHCLGRET